MGLYKVLYGLHHVEGRDYRFYHCLQARLYSVKLRHNDDVVIPTAVLAGREGPFARKQL